MTDEEGVASGRPRGTRRAGIGAVAQVLLALAGLGLLLGLVPRLLRDPTASAVYAVTGGDHRAAAALVVLVAAALPPAATAGAGLARRRRALGGLLLVPVVVLGLALLGLVPGRSDSGRVARSITADVGVLGSGEVLTGAAVGVLLGVLTSVTATLAAGLAFDRRHPVAVPRGRPDVEELVRVAAGEVGPQERTRLRRRGVVQVSSYLLVWAVVLVVCVLVAPA